MTPALRSPRWAAPASLTLTVIGLLVSAYLTYEHYTSSSTLACSDNGKINCLKVTTSSYAKIFGVIPVADLGLFFFLAMTVLCLPVLWRSENELVARVRLGGCLVGLVSALYLIGVEILGVDAICLWCTGVHVVTFLLFVVVALAGAYAEPDL
ncbi:MAG: Vitamin epoxide reductase [Marmoricola sp.]|nr:Vitamin epoxide reductase [Marmoricola sp.]